MLIVNPLLEKIVIHEPVFRLFLHKDLFCCVQRMPRTGNYNGYVGLSSDHPLYGLESDSLLHTEDLEKVKFNGNYIGLLSASLSPETQINMLPLNMLFEVHGGISYSRLYLTGIEENALGNLWWFGFDTSHSGDIAPWEDDIAREFRSPGVYRTLDFVTEETKRLAEQLAEYRK